MKVEFFTDLRVYQDAFDLQQKIFELTKQFPKSEAYSLTDQIRRSSRSVGANIAEAWQKRRYPAHFISKLTDSDAELAETQHWVQTCLSCGYIDEETHADLIEKVRRTGSRLGKMIQTAPQWSGS